MAFTFYGYQPSRPEEYPLNDIIGKILGGYTDTTKARFLQPALAEELQKAKLYNQYYAPNMEAQIALRKAQTGEVGARTGLLGEQLRGTRIENQYLPEKLKAAIGESQANAQKAHLLQMIREQMLGGGQQNTSSLPESFNSMPLYQGQGMPDISEQLQSSQQPRQQQSLQGTNDFAKATIAMQALGLGKPNIMDVNGRKIAITPFGNIDTGVAGLTEQGKALAKEDAKKISNLEDTVLTNTTKMDTLNALNEDLASPQFEQLRQNPILGRHEIGWYEKFGSPEQQELIGRVKTNMGNIIKDSARDFAGQFRVGEQALLYDMKPNVGDSLEVMKGKSEALTYLNTMMLRRAELEADYMRNYGMTALQAKIAADRSIDAKEIKNEVKTILHPASSTRTQYNQEDLEFTAKKHGMSVEEVRKKLENR